MLGLEDPCLLGTVLEKPAKRRDDLPGNPLDHRHH